MTKKKFYVVWKGLKPGVYESWEECAAQIKGVNSALYKAFPDAETAKSAFKQPAHLHIGAGAKGGKKQEELTSAGVIWDSISVDGAWNTATGDMEYRGVFTTSGKEWFRQGPYRDGTNNIGEFLAIVHALALLKQKNSKKPVYSDSRTALTWVKNKRANTKLQKTGRNEILFELISRAETWLKQNSFENPLLKWQTDKWGEIPADFGRK
jgi:ribonuclease HI